MSDARNTLQDDTGLSLGVITGLVGVGVTVYFVQPDSFLTFCGTAVAGLFGGFLTGVALYLRRALLHRTCGPWCYL
jgi:hypothetical protein